VKVRASTLDERLEELVKSGSHFIPL